MREHFRENRGILIFCLIWFAINLLQSLFTEIMEDEAYYWLYSEYMDWGYFDHPPMVAFLVKIGYDIIPNTLGIRLFPSLLGSATIYIIWLLLPVAAREMKIFIWTVIAMSLMHLNVAGFAALPDIPLVFFTSLFFLVLKRYLEEDKLLQALYLGLIVAGMMYSKYHALLIIFFTLLSNWKLLTRRSFWMIVAIAVALYIPHLLWQFNHDFASFQYHLVSRNDPFQPRQILEYLGNQILVTGPFVGVILLYLAFSRKAGNNYERILKYNLIGFFGFFLFSSVRGHVEPHWTAAAFPPLVVLALTKVDSRPKLRKWLRSLAIASIPVVLVIRLYLVWNFLPLPDHVTRMFHEKDTWAREIEEVAGDLPVIFMNKYQYPSVYWFYTGKKAFTRNNVFYRRNQYDLWPFERELEGEKALLTRWGKSDDRETIKTVYDEISYYIIDKYCSFNRLKIKILNKELQGKACEVITIPIRISNPTEYPVNLDCDCSLPPLLKYSILSGKRQIQYFTIEQQPHIGILEAGEETELEVNITLPQVPGTYNLLISFGSDILYPGINGNPSELVVHPLAESGLASN